jgi:cytochrome c oxidase cbb3-type subunit II
VAYATHTTRHVKHLSTHTNLPLLFSLISVGFILLTGVAALVPSTWVSAHNAPVAGSQALTPEQQAGLRVYVSEGCPYCHTQQVRPLPEDSLFGRPSAPGDYARLIPLGGLIQIPEVLGTERTGPDLSDVAARQPSDVWQYIHLYQPRALVGASIMPAFQWLFVLTHTPDSASVRVPVPPQLVPSGMTVVATPRAKALVAYLLSLKQAPIAGSTTAPASASASATPASAAGAQLFASRCASCHQAAGTGVPGAFPPLAGDPVVNGPAPAHLAVIIDGLHGRAISGTTYSGIMPPWGALMSDAEIAAVATHERTSWGNHGSPVTTEDVTAARKLPPPTP